MLHLALCTTAVLACLVSGLKATESPLYHVKQLVELGKSFQDIDLSPSQGVSNSSYDYGFVIVETCKAFLEEYATQSARFTKCLVENARPFRFCETCVVPYKRASSVFSDLIGDSSCSRQLLMADRVQVVRLVNSNIEQVWQSAYCPDCFSSITEDHNGTVNVTLTNNTVHFFDLFQNMTDCLNQTLQDFDEPAKFGNTSFCDKCRVQYKSLNTHFTAMLDQTSSEVCMDIVDMMNYTRLKWSKDLHCSHRQGTLGPVLTITAFISALPVLFYVANRLFSQASDRTIRIQRRMKFPQSTTSYGSMSGNQQILSSDSQSNSFRSYR